MRQRFSLPQSTNFPTAAMPDSSIARRSRTYGLRCASASAGREVVRAVEVDRIDVLETDEAENRDRLRPRERDGFEVGLLDEHVLALRELPALDELVGLDVALVNGAPALLLDRRAALAMERAEGHVLPLGRESEANGDVDEAEADGSVPDRAHGKGEF